MLPMIIPFLIMQWDREKAIVKIEKELADAGVFGNLSMKATSYLGPAPSSLRNPYRSTSRASSRLRRPSSASNLSEYQSALDSSAGAPCTPSAAISGYKSGISTAHASSSHSVINVEDQDFDSSGIPKKPPSTYKRGPSRIPAVSHHSTMEPEMKKSSFMIIMSCFSIYRNVPLLLAPVRKGEDAFLEESFCYIMIGQPGRKHYLTIHNLTLLGLLTCHMFVIQALTISWMVSEYLGEWRMP